MPLAALLPARARRPLLRKPPTGRQQCYNLVDAGPIFPPCPAGVGAPPEQLEGTHAEFLADAQRILVEGGQVGLLCWERCVLL